MTEEQQTKVEHTPKEMYSCSYQHNAIYPLTSTITSHPDNTVKSRDHIQNTIRILSGTQLHLLELIGYNLLAGNPEASNGITQPNISSFLNNRGSSPYNHKIS
ncbi:Hypothetical predicted protein [Octopus vulgaris]|uniref:Uncharacterized protein n=1 Tax=Octopus vulgaris TaxID=6645 RepID=A0AA36F6P3_OCTVU|nr:Hypothetical predicted protein [Octopus vulgaris]